MSGGHDHPVRAGRRHLRPLTIAFGMVAAFMVVEALAGFWTGSLALISDAGHMATDTLGLGMALAAIVAADRGTPGRRRTYGLYRMEILAALANAILLFAVAGYVLYEAVRRLGGPPEVHSLPMLFVALAGLAVNLVAHRLLAEGATESLNLKGAHLEVIADLIGSIGVFVAAVVMSVTGWNYIDPIVAVGIGLFILPRAWRLAAEAVRILVQAAPGHIDLESLAARLCEIPGVVDVHDLHVWTLTSDMEVATAHLMTPDGVEPHPVLDQARRILDEYQVPHATLQVEPESHQGCAELRW